MEKSRTSEAFNSPLRAEIIAIGTELLMGEVTNSNASYLSRELAGIGMDIFYHTAVGDNPQRMQEVLRLALGRSNVLLITGGLGPTDDDLTVQSLAQLLDEPLIQDEASEAQIRQFFATRNMPMSPTNLKQALRPERAQPLFNRLGTALGLFWDVTEKVSRKGWGTGPRYIFAFPGVPYEMMAMWKEIALPRLKTLLPQQSVLITRSLKFVGLGESVLGEKLRDLMTSDSPTVSPYVGQAEVRIRIAAKAASESEGLAIIAPAEREILSRAGKYCYGADEETLEGAVAQILKENRIRLAVAESCTGGLVSSRLTDISGSAEYTFLNLVAYSNQAKEAMLRVPKETLETHGAVSPEVALEMAQGAMELAACNVGLSITGIAGPTGGSPEKPVGLAYIALTGHNRAAISRNVLVNPQYSRQQIKYWFSQYALHYLRLYILNLLDPDEQRTIGCGTGSFT